MIGISLLTAPFAAHADNRTLLVLGDSISAGYGLDREAGWVSLLSDRMRSVDQDLTVVNASISGDTTGGGLARLPDLIARHQPAAIIVELGGNDGLRGYPIGKIRSNLEAIVGLGLEADADVFVVRMQIPPNYGARYTRAFAGLYDRLAEAQNITLITGFLESVALESGLMQSDGIHPTADAQPLLTNVVWAHLEPRCQPSGCFD
ncbi:MAG: arylesterase [Pseudomonadota bacterium]